MQARVCFDVRAVAFLDRITRMQIISGALRLDDDKTITGAVQGLICARGFL